MTAPYPNRAPEPTDLFARAVEIGDEFTKLKHTLEQFQIAYNARHQKDRNFTKYNYEAEPLVRMMHSRREALRLELYNINQFFRD